MEGVMVVCDGLEEMDAEDEERKFGSSAGRVTTNL